jgi:hypothetical protein
MNEEAIEILKFIKESVKLLKVYDLDNSGQTEYAENYIAHVSHGGRSVGIKLRRGKKDNDEWIPKENYFQTAPEMTDADYMREINKIIEDEKEMIKLHKDKRVKYRKAYKLFRLKKGKLYPLYVNSDQEIPIGVWQEATPGEETPEGKVKSKLGPLAFRPGFHLTALPYAGHIGKKIRGYDGLYQAEDTVWCQVRCFDIDYTMLAEQQGKSPRDQYLKFIPKGGYYRYRTNPAATVDWYIAGEMIVDAILTQAEVEKICRAKGIEPQKTVAQVMQQLDCHREGGQSK